MAANSKDLLHTDSSSTRIGNQHTSFMNSASPLTCLTHGVINDMHNFARGPEFLMMEEAKGTHSLQLEWN